MNNLLDLINPENIELKGKFLRITHDNQVLLSVRRDFAEMLRNTFIVMSGESKKTSKVSIEDDGEQTEIREEDTQGIVDAYKALCLKYANVHRVFKKSGKHWHHIVKAAATAKRLKVDPMDYVQAIFQMYSEMNQSAVNIPFASQLHGDSAETAVVQMLARNKSMEGTKGRKKAQLANRTMGIDEDNHYAWCKRKLKEDNYTLDEVTYIETRQLHSFGEVASWVKRYSDRLKEKKSDG